MLVHDHQISAHHVINEAQYKVRQALFDNERDLDSGREVLGELKKTSRDEALDGIRKLMRYFTFADEPSMGGTQVVDSGEYREAFLANARRSAEGNSLKDLDLKDRLLKHRLSWMIYSNSFEGMPRAAKEEVYHQLNEILTSPTPVEGYAHLEPAEKKAIAEILRETKPDLAALWVKQG